ncbi:MAG: Fe-S cluster assembly protein SufD, partial [Bacteroidota bacterium]|nr:Fe-S cluster assembly protein SufD [Bacteroidota bacterium]
DKTIQMVSITAHEEHVMVQNRNLIIVGKNSKLNLVQCDDSTNHEVNFTNTVTEIFMDNGANVDHYKLQNLNNNSTLINTLFVHQNADSNISTNAITLNGGLIRNETHVKMNGRGANAEVRGLYLVDREQHVDNQVFIDHASPDCTSSQVFKGIADDNAKAVFNGRVLVRRDSQRTVALQSNKNIALTDKATIDAQPFLEIYADDVKCSHGATVGQLNEEAMFYIKSRGISEDDARLLLMYAFTADVIEAIKIEALRERMDDLVKKRLRGELSVCDQCVLHCSHPEKPISFEIDMSKI